MKKLVIVESPAKAKTINQYLGKEYLVKASFGHVRDLPSSVIGVDIEHNYEPKYIITSKGKKVIKELKSDLSKSNELILATDLDREGEAIAWHLVAALNPKVSVSRIVFNEITKTAIQKSIQKPRPIDQDLVDAQQGRRILDRLVGYKLSPFLWKKVYSGLSAGRVQSVAVRLIVEREDEINNFKPEKYWVIKAIFTTEDNQDYEADLAKIDDKSVSRISESALAKETFAIVEKSKYQIANIKKSPREKYPSPPFTTSTLQQEAARKLGMSVKQTMKIAQDLYEGMEINGRGTVALITYMRTDSVNLSDSAIKQAREKINKSFGVKYLPEKAKVYTQSGKRTQEAHEAIRPVDFNIDPEEIKDSLDSQHYRLYSLIWKRAIACQMSNAQITDISVETSSIKTSKVYTFLTKGYKIDFDGFLRVYEESKDEENEAFQKLPNVKVKDNVKLKKPSLEAKETQPPARYTEASLVKELEKKGIGRPSTYAPTIATIIERNYVTKDEKRLSPTEVGTIVVNLLKEHFDKVIDYNFTAHMEDALDDIAEGKEKWQTVVDEMYKPLSSTLQEKMKSVEKVNSEKELKEKCPECGKPLVERLGRFGRFIACSTYPKCKYTRPIIDDISKKSQKEVSQKEGKKCPKCKKGELVTKEGRFGPFFACSLYPKCKYTEAIENKISVKCPNDAGDLVQKRTRKGKIFYGCANYPKCKTAFWGEPLNESCPDCKNILIKENGKIKCSQCDYQKDSQ